MSEQKNLILALVLMMGVMMAYQYFILEPEQRAYEAEQARLKAEQQATGDSVPTKALGDDSLPAQPGRTQMGQTITSAGKQVSLADALTTRNSVQIETPELTGSINLRGALLDDLSLVNHKVSMDEGSPNIRLFTPAGVVDAAGESLKPYYASFGWRADRGVAVPNQATQWTADKATLTPDSPVTLTYTDANGVTFIQKISVDNDFMFTVDQSIQNDSGAPVDYVPMGAIFRTGPIKTDGMFILHEGPIAGLLDQGDMRLEEENYDDIASEKLRRERTQGWLGFTDKYWMSILIPDLQKTLPFTEISYNAVGAYYETTYVHNWMTVAPGAIGTTTNQLYAGAKIVETINAYEESFQIPLFYKTIDWGWFEIITRPFYWAIHYLFELTGNFGIAILLFTVIVKLALFPMANKQYISMAHMKKVQPKLKRLQERYKDDRAKLQQEMMALYKKEKVNPMAGCLPILIQIPIFFSLYKVLYVTLDMRHQPFYLWIKDLSAPDPLTPINLFGLIPWDPPGFIAIGILPILMGVTMWLQMKMNPTQMDPMQQQIMNFLPIIFTFILANFASGLVIYWTWNSILSILQQWVINRRVEALETR